MRRITTVPRAVFLVLTLAAAAWILRSSPPGNAAADDAPKAARPYGIDARTPWTASRFAGTPEPPPPYTTELAFPKLVFDRPVVLVTAKGIDRLFVGEVKGKVQSFPNDPNVEKADLVLDLAAAPTRARLALRHGLPSRISPENRYVYLCYVAQGRRSRRHPRLALRGEPDRPAAHRSSKRKTSDDVRGSGGHNGGCLLFGPRRLSLHLHRRRRRTPRRPTRSTPARTVATCSRRSCGSTSITRSRGKPYRVPPDNPFVNTPGARPGDLGVRLPQPLADELRPRHRRPVGRRRRLGAVGDDLPGRAGGNYGWSVDGGPTAGPSGGPIAGRRRSCRRSSTTPTPRRRRSPAATSIAAAPARAGRRLHLRRLPDRQGLGPAPGRQAGDLAQGAGATRRCSSSRSARTTTASSTCSTTSGRSRSTASCRTRTPAPDERGLPAPAEPDRPVRLDHETRPRRPA